jgi:outer membrane protein assembly factor BamB
VWSADEDVTADLSFPTPPAVVDGTLYLGEATYGSAGATVFAVDASTGALAWQSPTLGENVSTPAIPGDLGLGFVGIYGETDTGVDRGSVAALSLDDGTAAWRRDFGVRWVGDVVLGGSVVLVAVGPGRSSVGDETLGRVLALDPETGETVWSRAFDHEVGTLAPVGDRVYVGGSGGAVSALVSA